MYFIFYIRKRQNKRNLHVRIFETNQKVNTEIFHLSWKNDTRNYNLKIELENFVARQVAREKGKEYIKKTKSERIL